MVTHVQVLRGSRFADSWDGVGRRWIYLLPRPTAVEHEVHRLLWLQRVPLSVAQQIWRMAASWPLAAVHLETEPEPETQPEEATVTTMVVHSAWPFNMLRVRRQIQIARWWHLCRCDHHIHLRKNDTSGKCWKQTPRPKCGG